MPARSYPAMTVLASSECVSCYRCSCRCAAAVCSSWPINDHKNSCYRHTLNISINIKTIMLACPSAHWSHRMKTWRHPQNRKYITYSNPVRGGPSDGHRQPA